MDDGDGEADERYELGFRIASSDAHERLSAGSSSGAAIATKRKQLLSPVCLPSIRRPRFEISAKNRDQAEL